MAINEYNSDLDVKGRVLASTVPNSTGSIVTWNSSTNVFGLRTNAQIISDLNLSSNFVPYTGATANVNLGTRSITSTGGFIGNATTATTLATSRTINGTSFNGSANITTARWGTARNITIGDTTKSVNGSANVSWSLAEIGAASSTSLSNYVPYTGANQDVNLGTQNLTVYGSSILNGVIRHGATEIQSRWMVAGDLSSTDNVSWIIIDGFAANSNRQLSIEVETVSGNGARAIVTKRFIVDFSNSNYVSERYSEYTRAEAEVTRYGIGSVEKHSDTALKIPIIYRSSTPRLSFKVKVKAFTGNVSNLEFDTILESGSPLTADVPVNSYLDYNNFTNTPTIPTPSDYITTNTTQTGLSGNKTTNGSWSWTGNAVPITLIRSNNASIKFQNPNDEGFYAGLRDIDTFAIGRGQGIGNMSITHTSFWLDIDSGLVSARGGFNKYGQNDTQILLAGGGHRPVSDFALASSLGSYVRKGAAVNGTLGSQTQDLNSPILGTYLSYVNSGSSNKPIGDGGFLTQHYFQSAGTDYVSQEFISLAGNRFFKRSNINESFVELYHTGNFNPSDYALASALSGYVPTSRTITAGNGLSGGGTLAANRTITLGTPSAIGLGTTNSVASTSHTHALDTATTTAINQGVTAHGWGDHSIEGYLTSSALNGYATENFVEDNFAGAFANAVTSNSGSTLDLDTASGNFLTYALAASQNQPSASGTAGGAMINIAQTSVGNFQIFLARDDEDNFRFRNNIGNWYKVASREWVASQGFSTQTLTAGSNITISGNTISATNTNTTYTAGTGLSLTGTVFANTAPNATHTGDVTGATALTIANSAVTHAKYQNIATQRILGRGATGTGNVQELTLGANLSLSTAGVLSATNTNTTYSAGTGLSLSGTTFGQAITTSGTGTFVTGITQTTNGFQVNLGTPPNTTYSAGTVALLTAGTNQTDRVWRADYLNQGIKALTYNPDNLTFGSGLNYNTSTGVLTANIDSIFAYSPQGGLYTTNWSSNALGQYSLAIGHASNATAQNATAIGSAVFTGGFGSTNVGFSSNVNKSLAGNFGTYNTNNHREAFTYGLGLQSASTWQTVIGRYNKPNGMGDIDDWTIIRNPIFVLGVGQDEMNRKNAVSAFGDGRLDYEYDRDDTYWNDNTLPDIRWINENVGSGGSNSIPFVNEGELIEEDGLPISGLSIKGYVVTSGTNPTGLDSIYVSNLDYLSGEYISVDTVNVYNRIVVSTSIGRPAVSNGTISLDDNLSGNDVTEITNMLSNKRMLLCIVLTNDGVEYSIAEISLLGTEEIVGITMSDPTIKIVKVGSFYEKGGRLFIDVDPKII